MRTSPLALSLRVAFMLSLGWVIAALATTTFAPRLLLLDAGVLGATAKSALILLVAACALSSLLAFALVSRVRPVFEADPAKIEPQAVYGLYRLPMTAAAGGLLATCAVTLLPLLPALRPHTSDLFTQASLTILLWTNASASVLVVYVALRAFVGQLIAALPPQTVRDALARHHEGQPKGHVRSRLVLATIVSVTFVALSSSLLAAAHARALQIEARESLARDLALGVAAPLRDGDPGPAAALQIAEQLGYQATIEEGVFERGRTVYGYRGTTELHVLTPKGHVHVTFETAQPTVQWALYLALFVLSGLLAWTLASWVGGFYERDLTQAAIEVKKMSERATEAAIVADVTMEMAHRPRPLFAVTAELLGAVDAMREVFGRFAEVHRQSTTAKEQTERMRALFLASMSHDLKGPLNAILGFAELLRKQAVAPAQRENIDIIAQRGRELLHLIQTVLDAARIEAGEMNLSPRDADVESVVADAVHEAQELLEGSKIDVRAEMPPTVPRILADPTRLTQAIVNVIASVARFTREGATIMVRVSLVLGAQTVQVDVVSPGGGMADAELEKVFVAFRFPEQARKFGSLGLGLYIARTVMEIHGGAIHVMSGRSAAHADGAPSPSTPALDAVAAAKDGIVFRLTIGAREQAESIHVRSMRVLPAS